jgi:hypothetical protein
VLQQWKRATAACQWAAWSETGGLINCTNGRGDLSHDQAVWELHADEVAASGKRIVAAYILTHKNTEILYMHLLVAHTPDFIRSFGDLRP